MPQVWKAFEKNPITHSAVHHLIAIAQLINDRGYARITDVASCLEITRGSVSMTLKSLEKDGLVCRDRNRFLLLTPEGEFVAQATQMKKQLFKQFLRDVLEVSEEDADIDSCKIEHLIGLDTGHRLCELMHFFNSAHPAAEDFLRAFRKFRKIRCEVEDCVDCGDHCLLSPEA